MPGSVSSSRSIKFGGGAPTAISSTPPCSSIAAVSPLSGAFYPLTSSGTSCWSCFSSLAALGCSLHGCNKRWTTNRRYLGLSPQNFGLTVLHDFMPSAIGFALFFILGIAKDNLVLWKQCCGRPQPTAVTPTEDDEESDYFFKVPYRRLDPSASPALSPIPGNLSLAPWHSFCRLPAATGLGLGLTTFLVSARSDIICLLQF